jgi:hypothetical protein
VTVWAVSGNADAGSFEVPDNRFRHALPGPGRAEVWLFMSEKKFEVECYAVDGGKQVRTIRPEADDPKRPYQSAGIWPAVSPDGSVFASNVSRFHFYDAATGKIAGDLPRSLWDSPAGFIPGPGVRYLARISRDAAKSTGLAETTLVVYDQKAARPLAALTGHGPAETEMMAAASADGRTVVSVSKAGEGLVFDLSGVR